ncbi:CrcB protein [Herbihabitans rhizosphaerae]|uniref:Fluoride-specific ion channel FluC n=1 Tax=Herbihabitans rhizosphaerae TaxID=1872711 RepID=A0A4Q7KRV5_9PSEU|nr:fluoride efflux transporter CrcB [Herbihabitans rhizosphaerae]RZS38820.1 CrcB protein [Herbihabitans rhizosphaerae]
MSTQDGRPFEAVDPDVDLHDEYQRDELTRERWHVPAAIAAGGALGAVARYGISAAFPHPGAAFPWATFGINLAGCLLIGVLMVFVAETEQAHPLLRPFAGVGVLGGFTTFSAYVEETRQLVAAHAWGTAAGYVASTLIGALLSVYCGLMLGRALR